MGGVARTGGMAGAGAPGCGVHEVNEWTTNKRMGGVARAGGQAVNEWATDTNEGCDMPGDKRSAKVHPADWVFVYSFAIR